MGWDPSMSTKGCDVCGQTVEGWIGTYDDCIEKAYTLKIKFDKFATQFDRLISQGNELVEGLKSIGINQSADQMKFYLLNRMQNFVDGAEIFEFESIENALKEIIGEDEDE